MGAIRARIRLIGLATALTATPLAAQQVPAPYTLAIAAGYKAAITCSAVFIGGRTQEQIARDELSGIYPEYDAIVPTLKADVDAKIGLVTVAFDPALPPRRAVYRKGRGCTIMPIGAVALSAPDSDQPTALAQANPAPWPIGDALPKPAYPQLGAVARAMAGAYSGRTTGIVVLRGKALVAESYADGFGPYTAQRTWSVAKSITGTLVGIAVKEGAVRTDAPARIPEWADEYAFNRRRQITLDNLLRMASGLHSDTAGNRSDAVYFGGTAVTEETVHWPIEVKPGTRFRYANNDILLAMRSLRAALGEARYKNFPATALFDRIGMKHTVAETDWRGNYISSSQIWTTARDLARFGLLYLDDGFWNGKRVLPEDWRRYVTTPNGPQPAAGFGYGATFWLMNKVPGVPADTFSANGNRGQFVVIVPSRNIVIVRRGEDPAGAPFDIAKFTADVLASVK
ncbi:MAG: serine hydrolase [Sphingomonas sp. 28-62-20]|uniref:serine hydrolase domain-containing protein n=1 Tax=Sphingomonas sp. 28-62-20 TaxID=1970433 RepID=UPI000BD54D14|nr:MAG: serine hydrolase [Sphingomonas sp. 28-62-20]